MRGPTHCLIHPWRVLLPSRPCPVCVPSEMEAERQRYERGVREFCERMQALKESA